MIIIQQYNNAISKYKNINIKYKYITMVKYAIIKTINGNKFISHFINDQDEFKDVIMSSIESNSDFNDEIIEKSYLDLNDINYTNELLNDKDGLYLFTSDKKLALCEKKTNIIRGYIYNSSEKVINVLSEWEITPIRTNDSTNNSENDKAIIEELKVERELLPKPIPNLIEKIMFKSDLIMYKNVPIIKPRIKLRNFDLDLLCDYSNVHIIGKRGSMTRYLIHNMINNLSAEMKSNMLIIVNPHSSYSTNLYDVFKNLYPNATISTELSDDIIDEYMNQVGICTPGVILFINFFNNKLTFEDKMTDKMYDLFYCSRHYKKKIILKEQVPIDLDDSIKMCFDYNVLYSEDYNVYNKEMYKNYVPNKLMSFEKYKMINNKLNCYESIVINNKEKKMYKCKVLN